jgi:hypothetical protein
LWYIMPVEMTDGVDLGAHSSQNDGTPVGQPDSNFNRYDACPKSGHRNVSCVEIVICHPPFPALAICLKATHAERGMLESIHRHEYLHSHCERQRKTILSKAIRVCLRQMHEAELG